MMDPISPITHMQQVALTQLKLAARHYLSREMATLASTVQLNAMVDDMTDHLVFELRARVLAEQLPPQTIRHHVRVTVDDPRFATWWDTFKATYQKRWWMRWRTWTINYIKTPVTVARSVEVNVRDHWTYPRAAIALPDQFGRPVMVATWTASDFPLWTDRG